MKDDREKKIAEIREGYKSERDDNFTYKKEIVEQDIRFLLTELERLQEENRKLKEDLEGVPWREFLKQVELEEKIEKLIDALRKMAESDDEWYVERIPMRDFARDTLKAVGVEVE